MGAIRSLVGITNSVGAGDDTGIYVPIGFAFPMYDGSSRDHVWINENGNLNFGGVGWRSGFGPWPWDHPYNQNFIYTPDPLDAITPDSGYIGPPYDSYDPPPGYRDSYPGYGVVDTVDLRNQGRDDGIYSDFDTFGPLIAAFWSDVDTRGHSTDPDAGAGVPKVPFYGNAVVDGTPALVVNWIDVGYYSVNVDKLNSFQMILWQNGCFEFNYDQIQWELGRVSFNWTRSATDFGGVQSDPRVGISAVVGYYFSSALRYEHPGSHTGGAFLDGGPLSLVDGSNVGVPGRWRFCPRAMSWGISHQQGAHR